MSKKPIRTLAGVTGKTLRAGVAKSDITTDATDAVVRDPLYAKALVLDDGATTLALIAMDTTAIGGRSITAGILNDNADDFMSSLRHGIEQQLNIPGGNVLVNASHTHPPGRLLCDDTQQVNRIIDAVRRAMRSLTPVTIGAGIGHEDRITMNRTLQLRNGRQWTIRHSTPCPPDEEIDSLGLIDPDIGVIRIDRLDGRPLAVVYNFACHLLFGDAKGSITGNFPAVASNLIEDTLGHGAMAIFLQGAGGDIVDVLFKDFNRPRDIAPLGTMLGLSTLKAWRNIHTTSVSLSVISETVALPRRTGIAQEIASFETQRTNLINALAGTALNFKSFLPLYLRYTLSPDYPLDYAYSYLHAQQTKYDALSAMDTFNRRHIEKYLANIEVMEQLVALQDELATLKKHQSLNAQAGESTINAEVQGIRIGDCVLLASPAELLVEIGLNIKKDSPYRHTFVAAFSNGYLHYGPPAADYGKRGYEVTECLLAPQWQRIYENKAAEIIRRL